MSLNDEVAYHQFVAPWDEQQRFNPTEDAGVHCEKCGIAYRDHPKNKSLTDEVAEALSKLDQMILEYFDYEEGYQDSPMYAAIRHYGDLREKLGQEETAKVAACPFDHATLMANAVALCVNCGARLSDWPRRCSTDSGCRDSHI